MFDIFKKPDEEQDTVEQVTEPIEVSEIPEVSEETVKEETQSAEVKTPEPFESKEADLLATLEALGGEEKTLVAEKSQLLDMEETLRQKIIDEIEVKRHRIENLKYEIPELKQRCEALAKVLDIPVQK
jgi:predicted RNase H-like nuclease (RuvC/YqgF family)